MQESTPIGNVSNDLPKPEICEMPEFEKCMHHLRKYKTIEEDLKRFKKILLTNFPDLEAWGMGVEVIPGFGGEFHKVYKARKFRCEYLKKTDKIRLIYTYNPYENKVIFIEVYYKEDQKNHNSILIKKYLVRKRDNPNKQ